jgi:hypothetical protein
LNETIAVWSCELTMTYTSTRSALIGLLTGTLALAAALEPGVVLRAPLDSNFGIVTR